MSKRLRVLLVSSHPVQYSAPLYRLMANDLRFDVQVAYCSLQGAEPGFDPEFGVEVQWDVPLLDGYQWVHVPNKARRPGLGRFWGLVNPGLWKLVRQDGFDAVVVYTGYAYASFWIVLVAAKLHRRPIIFGTDASSLSARDGTEWKGRVKRWVWPRLFGLASVVIVSSSRAIRMMQALGIPDSRLVLTPSAVNNDWWIDQAEAVDRASVREAWGVPLDAPVVLFCGKLLSWKRPQDLLDAFAHACVTGSHLVFAGDGALRAELESRSKSLGVDRQTHFLGFVNQSRLPAVYRASDLFVRSSENEPFGNVVNEAMLCRCAALVSDRSGASDDLVRPGQNGYVFPCGNVNALASLLGELLVDRQRLCRMGEAARVRMQTWSHRENIQALAEAVGRGVAEGR